MLSTATKFLVYLLVKYMQEIGKQIFLMEMGFTFSLLEKDMRENLKKDKNLEKEFIIILMETVMKENGLKISKMDLDNFFSTLLENAMRVNF